MHAEIHPGRSSAKIVAQLALSILTSTTSTSPSILLLQPPGNTPPFSPTLLKVLALNCCLTRPWSCSRGPVFASFCLQTRSGGAVGEEAWKYIPCWVERGRRGLLAPALLALFLSGNGCTQVELRYVAGKKVLGMVSLYHLLEKISNFDSSISL